MRYFRVLADNRRFPDKWFLGEPLSDAGEEIDAREFTYGQVYTGPAPADVPVEYIGTMVKFNLAAFNMPVVSQTVADLIRRVAPDDCEWFPVTVGSGLSGYFIMNAAFTEACVDEERSKLKLWEPEHTRPNAVGKYDMIFQLTIDPARTNGRHFFRVKDWEVALIASERIREAAETTPGLGIEFDPVC